MKVTVRTDGLAELTARLQAMPVKVSARFIKAAGRAALGPVLREVKRTAPVDTGLLRDTLRIASRSNAGGDVPLEIGITAAKKIVREDLDARLALISRYGGNDAKMQADNSLQLYAGWRWHFVETGAPGAGQPARPFIRPAFDAGKQQVLERFRDQLRRRIEKFDSTPPE